MSCFRNVANSVNNVLEVSLIGWVVHCDQANGVFEEDVVIRLIYSNDLKETLR